MRKKEIYTKSGDGGVTTTLSQINVPKDDSLVEAIGILDELMVQLDKVIYGLNILPDMKRDLKNCVEIRKRLHILGGEISGKKDENDITDEDTTTIENNISDVDADLEEFIDFSNPISIDVNELRVRIRKLERFLTPHLRDGLISSSAYKYINRLSDYFFILSVNIDETFK